jgi:chromate transporter
MEDRVQWLIAAAAFAVTVLFKAEVAVLFIVAGLVGVLYYGSLFRGRRPPAVAASVALPVGAVTAPHAATSSMIGKLVLFFLKSGSLTFGSGLVIVPFLEKGLVQQTGWLTPRDFLIAVTVGMMSPGPVVITATFVGFLVAGFWGALASTVAIFLPSFLLVLIVAPLLKRHRGNKNVQGFVKGTYGAAIGTILGAAVLLGRTVIGDLLTVAIAVAALVLLFRFKLGNPILIAGAAVIGLVAYPLLQPGWVLLK